MPKYAVTIETVVKTYETVTYEVEADDEDAAMDKANDLFHWDPKTGGAGNTENSQIVDVTIVGEDK